jgi:hypothetical protein
MTDEDLIWNRASEPLAELQAPGDRALQALLVLHGYVMNGGLYSAMYGLSFEELGAAAEGFDYFGRTDVADILRDATSTVFPGGAIEDPERREAVVDEFQEQDPERLDGLDDDYHRLVPSDEALVQAFRERLRAAPEDFAAAA